MRESVDQLRFKWKPQIKPWFSALLISCACDDNEWDGQWFSASNLRDLDKSGEYGAAAG